jgi:hypothetical protein
MVIREIEADCVQASVNIVTAGTLPSSAAAPAKSMGATNRPALPPVTTQAADLFHSVAAFVGDGCALVDDEEYRQRLQVCHTCERRAGRRCTECGCWIGVKARGRAFRCPLDRWDESGDTIPILDSRGIVW